MAWQKQSAAAGRGKSLVFLEAAGSTCSPVHLPPRHLSQPAGKPPVLSVSPHVPALLAYAQLAAQQVRAAGRPATWWTAQHCLAAAQAGRQLMAAHARLPRLRPPSVTPHPSSTVAVRPPGQRRAGGDRRRGADRQPVGVRHPVRAVCAALCAAQSCCCKDLLRAAQFGGLAAWPPTSPCPRGPAPAAAPSPRSSLARWRCRWPSSWRCSTAPPTWATPPPPPSTRGAPCLPAASLGLHPGTGVSAWWVASARGARPKPAWAACLLVVRLPHATPPCRSTPRRRRHPFFASANRSGGPTKGDIQVRVCAAWVQPV